MKFLKFVSKSHIAENDFVIQYKYIIYMFNFLNNDKEIGVGVDIGYNTIKVVELVKDNEGITLQNYGEVELASYAGLEYGQSVDLGDEVIAKALRDLFVSSKINLKNVYVSIPAVESFLFTIDIKKVEGIEINNVIELEIRKYIPIPASELVIDHWPIETDEVKGRMKISVIAVKRSIVTRYVDIFKKADINILGFEMETFAMVRSLQLTKSNYLLVDTGGAFSTVTLISKGILYKSNTIQIGGNNITSVIKNSLMKNNYKDTEIKKRKLINREIEDNQLMSIMDITTYPLLEELGHIGENLERGYNLNIDEVVFVGGNAHACLRSMKLKSCFTSPTRLGIGFKDIKYPEYLNDLIERVGTSYVIACGLALKKFIKKL